MIISGTLDLLKISDEAKDCLVRSINLHEGYRQFCYKDENSKLTIGYGYNLTDNGVSKELASLLRDIKVQEAWQDLSRSFPCFQDLNDARKIVLLEMVYQIGMIGVLRFQKFVNACISGNIGLAKKEMLDSEWAKNYPSRAISLSNTFELGVLPNIL